MATQHRRRRSRARRRRIVIRRPALIPLLPIAVGVVVVAAIIVGIFLANPVTPATPKHSPLAAACPKVKPVVVSRWTVPAGPVAGFCQAELVNAVHVIAAGRASDAPTTAQEIAVMTAIGESGLQNLSYGDTAGPDSRGLFQQRKNWGPLATRMDPYEAAKLFYGRLLSLPGWQKLTPTQAAHAVQGNADPGYYTQYLARAQELVAEFSARNRIPIPTSTPIPGPTTH